MAAKEKFIKSLEMLRGERGSKRLGDYLDSLDAAINCLKGVI